MGSARHRFGSLAAALAVVALVGCSGGEDEAGGAAATDAASAATVAGAAEGTVESGETAAGGDSAGGGVIAPAAQVPGQAIAIEAHATLQADDVRAAVDRLTTIVTTRGGRVTAADVDYDPDPTDDEHGDDVDDARATLVLAVPPAELPSMADELAEIGTLTSFVQRADDVTEQLADLGSRIANMRASVERVRALLAAAVDIDGVVRLEAELTSRETQLEQLLAAQRQLDDRVAMSSLTVEITTTPAVLTAAGAEDDPGILDALAAGWSAFTTGLFRVVLVLAATAPFIGAVALLAAVALLVRRVVRATRPV